MSKAVDFIRRRWQQGVQLILLEFVITAGIYHLLKLYASPSVMAKVESVLVCVVMGVLGGMFESAVSMVFYYDCNRSYGGDGMGIKINIGCT